MTRTTTPTPRPARPRRTSPRSRPRVRGTVGALLAVAVVATAGAPSIITIRSGDTLWDLARAHNTSVAQLQALNGLSGNATIYAGRTLRLPSSTTRAASAGGASQGLHKVRPGDSLSVLARQYSTTTRAIMSANGLSSSRIRIGQQLRIPGTARGSSPVPTTNAGATISSTVRSSVASHRATLAARSHPSKTQVRRMVASTARRHGVPTSLAVAVAYHESGFQQRVVSPVDAIGVMQVLPSTARVLSRQHGRTLDLLNTQDNITAGVLLLRQLLRSTGSTDKALAGYYQGLGSIARKGILPQTRAYLNNIHVLQARYRNG